MSHNKVLCETLSTITYVLVFAILELDSLKLNVK